MKGHCNDYSNRNIKLAKRYNYHKKSIISSYNNQYNTYISSSIPKMNKTMQKYINKKLSSVKKINKKSNNSKISLLEQGLKKTNAQKQSYFIHKKTNLSPILRNSKKLKEKNKIMHFQG